MSKNHDVDTSGVNHSIGYRLDSKELQKDEEARTLLINEVRAQAGIGDGDGYESQRLIFFDEITPFIRHFGVSLGEEKNGPLDTLNRLFVNAKSGRNRKALEAFLAWLCATNPQRASRVYALPVLNNTTGGIPYREPPDLSSKIVDDPELVTETNTRSVPKWFLFAAVVTAVVALVLQQILPWDRPTSQTETISESGLNPGQLAQGHLDGIWGEEGCAVTYLFDVRDRALKIRSEKSEAGMDEYAAELTILSGEDKSSQQGERIIQFEMVIVSGDHESEGVTFNHSTNGSTERLSWDHRNDNVPAIKLARCEETSS